jgi:hypothetical protein
LRPSFLQAWRHGSSAAMLKREETLARVGG